MRSILVAQVAACCLGLVVAGCKSREPERARSSGPAPAAVSDRPAVLAELPEEVAREGGPEFVFSERGGGVAYVAEAGGTSRVVHNGRAGKAYAAVAAVVLSPDGRRCAHAALVDGRWRVVVDGKEGAAFDAVESPVFSPDGAHLAYQARVGERWHLVVDGAVNGGTRTRYAWHAFGAESSRIAFVDEADEEGWGRLVVSDLSFKNETVVDARVSSAILNGEKSRLAAVGVSDGRQRVLTFGLDKVGAVTHGPMHDAIYNLAFATDGVSLAYVAERSGERFVVLNEREEPLPPGDQMVTLPVVRPDNSGVGAAVVSNGSVFLREFFGRDSTEAAYGGIEGLVYAGDGHARAYVAEMGQISFIVANGKEGPPFDRVVSPMFSPDGKRLVYRARKDGKRFVVVADTEGKTVKQHPPYEQVFPVRFTADGKSVAYGVKDGRQLAWKVEPL